MAFDGARGNAVLFGGSDVSPNRDFNDTWTWDGSDWTQVAAIDLVADEIARAAEEVLRLVGLSGYDRQMPHQLSGGEQQRVTIARLLTAALVVLTALTVPSRLAK